ncbi:MAG: hypothetical protein Ta2A_22100 [Treponemataceae bacterium]|nr:MAG: hypothetical protein Ta2A_22100 [Treponemataceae bacterium]
MLHRYNFFAIFFNNFFAAIFYFALLGTFSACGPKHVFPVTFEKMDITDSLPRDAKHILCAPTFDLYFSIEPEKQSAQNAFFMKKHDAGGTSGAQVSGDFFWKNDRTLAVRPSSDWTMGAFYSAGFSGNIIAKSGATYSCNFTDSFFYGGDKDKALVLKSVHVENVALNGTNIADTQIQFVFSKNVSLTSFSQNFSISPHRNFAFAENTEESAVSAITVCIKGGLSSNTLYTWTLNKALCANDGFSMLKSESGDLPGIIDTEQPVIKAIKIENAKKQKAKIEITFSKPMEYFSVSNAFTIEPSVQGYIEQNATEKAKFTFVPQQNYKAETKYKVSIASFARDVSGIGMFESFEAFLVPFTERLKIENVIASNVNIPAADMSSGTLFDVNSNNTEVIVKIVFSKAIDEAAKVKAVESLSVKPVFPLAAAFPRLAYASWDTSSVLYTKWTGFSISGADSPKIYAVRITGGEAGISTGRSEYMEDDVCVYLRIL